MKPCLICGRPTQDTRCLEHAGPISILRAERRRRTEVIDAWVARNGWVCPGYGVPAHLSRDLTADHITPRALGGEAGPLGVLCRSCNARRGVPRPEAIT